MPGAIQQHGALLALSRGGGVAQASANAPALFGVAAPPASGAPLAALVGAAAAAQVEALVASSDLDGRDPAHAVVETPTGRCFDVIAHRHEGVVILEFEPSDPAPARDYELLVRLHRELDQLAAGEPAAALWRRATRMVRDVTGMDRVMIYRFDADWHGEVVAEEKRADLDALLGLHYPATDIPAQARRLYVENRVRFIPDVRYRAVPVLPAAHPETGRPLDMSFAGLRSVSPIHVEYLNNMGVRATLVISLIVDGRLWGLIACHHYDVLALSYMQRRFAGFVGQTLGLLLAEAQRARALEETIGLHEARRRIEAVAEPDPGASLESLLEAVRADLLAAFQASAVLAWNPGGWTAHGASLDAAAARGLVEFLRARLRESGPTWSTAALAAQQPTLEGLRGVASGVLALRFDAAAASGVAYLRPEQVVEVNWAGDPRKTATLAEEGTRLSPRRSFAAWKEVVHGRSRAWSPAFERVLLDLARAGERLQGRAARANLQLLERAAAASGDSIVITDARVDAPGPVIAYVNPAFTRLTGYAAADVLGRNPRMLQGPTTDRRRLDRVRRAMQRGESCRVELVNRRADGSEYRIDMSVDPVFAADGGISHYVGVQRDITDAHRVRAQLGRLNEELSRRIADEALRLREALHTMDEYDRTIARDLQAPLRAIGGFARRLAAAADRAGSAEAPLAQRVRANVARVESLIDEIAAFHDRLDESAPPAAVDMRALAGEAARALAAEWPELAFEIAPLPGCQGNPALLRQLWRQLLGNAARAAYRREPARVAVAFAAGFYVVSGPGGGDTRQVQRLLERMGESERFIGTGIATVIVERIVALHRGHVHWEPQAGGAFQARFSVPPPPGG